MATHARLHAPITFLVILSLVLTSVTPVLAAAPARLPQGATLQPSPEADLFRTTVTLAGAADRQRLERLDLVMLEAGESWATVLVDASQLESLARLGFTPQGTESAATLVETAKTKTPWLAAAVTRFGPELPTTLATFAGLLEAQVRAAEPGADLATRALYAAALRRLGPRIEALLERGGVIAPLGEPPP